ncbi:HET domain-containing protein [Colletotrichum scovillei]|uniref:HET domain-containing protein n=1 Tax=Colletotrichum scovillei TaxID=1209932 RepID=A0A9P7UBK3_9PEZI|nr:HET domain-containing protein [Colletotrichum scovillei]KAF4780676.1 HET domain-containing protein [Colletotrichum scovillei]KAG7045174.1 HET domain-containing protein [Colletotrichum scovillei]KAG7052336.1 HET domain-containing protein [Colletotrichum scovillei]KAG7064628.1 HET domain-containing protein [Colletotrichum scovillei]
MTTQYHYTPFSTPKSIRLIRLVNTADKSSPLECSFEETSLDNPVSYAALSYTWGGEPSNVPLRVVNNTTTTTSSNGAQQTPQPPLMITPNCAAVLNILRGPRIRDLSLWVDAVCINQSSNDEKTVQVGMMAELYEKAKYVFVWLGNEWAPASVLALYKGVPKSRDDHEPDLDPALLSKIQRAPYWLRVWTLQEATYNNTFILCLDGGGKALSTILQNWGDAHTSHPDPNQLAINMRRKIIKDVSTTTSSTTTSSTATGTTGVAVNATSAEEQKEAAEIAARRGKLDVYHLRMLLYLQSTEPRDKIYALRSIFPETFGKVAVDYTDPVEKVYREATRQHIMGQDSLTHLLLLDGGNTSTSASTATSTTTTSSPVPDLPFWALNWNKQVTDSRYLLDVPASSSRDSKPSYRFSPDGRTLYLKGRSVGRIGDRISPKLPLLDLSFVLAEKKEDFIAWVGEARRISQAFLADILSPPPTDASKENQENALQTFRSIQALLVRILHADPQTEPDAASLAALSTAEALAEAVTSQTPPAWLNIGKITASIGSGCMFLTTHNHFGFCVSQTEPGDEICVFSGLNVPFVVRSRGSGSGYIVVGYAVVDGVMDGEAWPDDEGELEEWALV